MNHDWLRRGQYLTAMGVEASWFYALLSILNDKISGGPVSVPLLLLFLPAAFVINKLLERLNWHLFFLKSVSWMCWAALTLIMIKVQLYSGTAWWDSDWLLAVPRSIALILSEFPAEVMILFTTPFLWWLGQRLAYLKPSFSSSIAEFQFGLIMIMLIFLIGFGLDIKLIDAIPVAMTFFAFALLGMAVAHAGENSGWGMGASRAHWPGLVAVSIIVVLAGGLVIAILLAPGILQAFIAAVKWTWDIAMKVLYYLASLIPPQPPVQLPPGMSAFPSEPSEEPLLLLNLSETWRKILQIVWTTIFVGITLIAVWRMSMSILDWLRRRLAAGSGGEYERLDGALKQDFLSLLKAFLLFLFRPREWKRRRRSKILREAATVRQIYQQLLKWAAGRGYARRVCETPYEYLSGSLLASLRKQEAGLVLITDQYVKARYGGLAPTAEELRGLKETWNKIKNTGD